MITSLDPARWFLPGLVCLLLCGQALAQQPETSRPGPVTFSGSVRARAESWRWFETPGAQDAYTFGALQLRLALSQKTERLDWMVEVVAPALFNLPADAVRPPPEGQLGLGGTYFAANGRQDASAAVRQGFARIKGIFGDKAGSLRLGRFEFSDGAEVASPDPMLAVLKRTRVAQRLIGPFGFSHVGRGFDGIEYTRDSGWGNVTFLAARPTEGVFQLRSWNELNVDLYYGAFTRPFAREGASSEARFFLLRYHDGRDVVKTDNRPMTVRAADTQEIRLTTLGGHYAGVLEAGPGKADFLVWAAAQFGQWGLLDHRAGAIDLEGGYQFPAAWKPWARAGYFLSTGDGDPGDDDHTTFFQVLPTPRPYARFPIYNLMNNQDVFGELRLKPAEKLSLRTDVHALRLESRQDLWYAGGGAFQKETFGYLGRPAGGHAAMGTLLDLSLDYAVTPTTTLTLYLAKLFGGSVEASIYPAGGQHPGARFLYLEVLQRF